MDTQKNDPLAHEPFSFRATTGERVMLYYKGRHVETLTGPAAVRFLRRVEQATPPQAQLLMAKATKNFKRGNERAAKEKRGT